ncbi:hypothetical protein [Sphaerisporangium dianthi]|uniref:Secreted protein n=1 Tax=Sphaerisporangium dianthi TaxID=1436120 RepID=A0ABV9CGW0_9ACTN
MRMTLAKRASLGIVAAGSLLLAPAAAAYASAPAKAAVAVSCSGMVNPSGATGTGTAKSADLPGGVDLQLRSGRINNVQYAWPRLTTSHNGDRLWIDISGNSGRTWTQCDLRTLDTGRNYGNALKTSSSSSVCMRAGARPAGAAASYLTDWWC